MSRTFRIIDEFDMPDGGMLDLKLRYDITFLNIARSLRLAVVQQQYNLGNLTEEEAREILSSPLTPGDDATIVDDSDQLLVQKKST